MEQPPITMQGWELYCNAPGHLADDGQYYQVSQVGTVVHLHWGRHTQPGFRRNHHFATDSEASEFAIPTVTDLCLMRHYELAYTTGVIPAPPDVTERSPDCPDDPQAAAAQAHTRRLWAEHMVGVFPRPLPGHPDRSRAYWVWCTGLLDAHQRDHGAYALLTHLTAGPHVLDFDHDRILGRVGQLPQFRAQPRLNTDPDRVSTHFTASLLGMAEHPGHPRCMPCHTRTAELLFHQIGNTDVLTLSWEHRLLLTATARRLAHLPDHAAAVHA